MGFFSNFGKAIMGKPLPGGDRAPNSIPAQENGMHDGQGFKIIPVVNLKDVRSHRQGDQLIVTAWAMNDCDHEVRVDSCYLLKQKRQFNQVLGPRQSHQVTLYQGPAPRDENEHNAQLIYRFQANGDSFQKTYTIKYHMESDGTRTVDELHDDNPVRDI